MALSAIGRKYALAAAHGRNTSAGRLLGSNARMGADRFAVGHRTYTPILDFQLSVEEPTVRSASAAGGVSTGVDGFESGELFLAVTGAFAGAAGCATGVAACIERARDTCLMRAGRLVVEAAPETYSRYVGKTITWKQGSWNSSMA